MKKDIEKELIRIEKKVFRLSRQSEKLTAVNASLRRRVEELTNENEFLAQQNAVANKRYSSKKTKPHIRHAEYEGYIGSAVGAGDIFVFRTVQRWALDDEGFVALDMDGHHVSKFKDSDGWQKVKIVVDVVGDEKTKLKTKGN